MPRETLAHYEILEKLGEGGMGAVYLARDTKLDREVALKILPEHFAEDPERLARFEREGKLLASLNHPNIAAVYGLHHEPGDSEQAGVHFLAMELAEGEDLAARFARGNERPSGRIFDIIFIAFPFGCLSTEYPSCRYWSWGAALFGNVMCITQFIFFASRPTPIRAQLD